MRMGDTVYVAVRSSSSSGSSMEARISRTSSTGSREVIPINSIAHLLRTAGFRANIYAVEMVLTRKRGSCDTVALLTARHERASYESCHSA